MCTGGGVAGARGHRRRLQDDGVAAGGEPHRHLLIQDLPRSLNEEGNHKNAFMRLEKLNITTWFRNVGRLGGDNFRAF